MPTELSILLSLALVVATGLWLRSMIRGRRFQQQATTARGLNESANDAMLVADVEEGRILEANPAAAVLLGYGLGELIGRRLPELHPAALRGKSAVVIANVWQARGLVYSDLPFETKDGTVIDVETSARVIDYMGKPAVMILARDIRQRLKAERKIRDYAQEVEAANLELKEMQAQLVRSGQMASLGNLAAGLAHEINNPIGSINANVDVTRRVQRILTEGLEGGEGAPDAAKMAKAVKTLGLTSKSTEEAGQRIAGIVRSLRNFARLDEAEHKNVDLHEGIDSTLVLLRHKMGDSVTIDKHYGDLPLLECNAGQLNQVFMNVLLNALEALEGEGTIRISTAYDEGQYILTFKDTGKGIAPEHLERIFEPGFTTKGVGVGTGLGMSIAFRVVEEHGGTIAACSTPGEGTTVTLRCPGNGRPDPPMLGSAP